MKKTALAVLVVAGVASPALAGGLDRSGMGISALFQSGNYAEVGMTFAQPHVTGSIAGLSSGNMASSFFMPNMSVKMDITDRLSAMVQFEEAYGAAVDYTNADPLYPIPPFTASLSGTQTSVLGRYRITDNIAVHAGVRMVNMSGTVDFTGGLFPITYNSSSGVGFSAGASYEIPDIALRAAITYNSATSHNNTIVDPTGGLQTLATATGAYKMPQSINFDFQTGIAKGTLVMASVRWVDWTASTLNTQTALGSITHARDSFTYMAGVGHKFTDNFSAVAQVTYEPSNGLLASNLSPTDGKIGLSLAGVLDVTDNVTVTGGVNYTRLGDATTVTGSSFTGNYGLGGLFKVGIHF
ncbi:MAG: hypothetical protein D6801_06405 [Alphaproteobacteria bacterium]|nr:MAG: hypothetical protein D6801_06405 [Alphaproteobacteria bacterium]